MRTIVASRRRRRVRRVRGSLRRQLDSSPCRSIAFQAAFTRWNSAAAFGSFGFRSGWVIIARRRYAFRHSVRGAPKGT